MAKREWSDDDVYNFTLRVEEHGGKVLEIHENMGGYNFIVSGIPLHGEHGLQELMTAFDRQRS